MKIKGWWISLWKEQPDERFFSLPLVKFVLLIFGSLFIVTVTFGIKTAVALQFDWSSTGINNVVFNLFKSPIAIIGFSLPILGLIGLNHRSEQTKQQIQLSESQNNFSNYYKHIEEFEKYLSDSINASSWFKDTTHHRQLHCKLFPKSNEGNFDLCQEFIEKMEHNCEQLESEVKSHIEINLKKTSNKIKPMTLELRKFADLFNLNEENIATYNKNMPLDDKYLEMIWNYLSMANSILSFYPKYEENEKLLTIMLILATAQIQNNAKEIKDHI